MARNTSALPNSIETAADENSSFSSINLNSSPKSLKTEVRTPVRQGFGTPKTPLSASVAASSPLAGSPASSTTSSSSGRRTRRMWTEAEEAILISGVEKHGQNAWDKILEENQFNNRTISDLKQKYRSLSRADGGLLVDQSAIFDIRSVNAKVTEVFYGADWSSASWIRVEEIEPKDRFERLLNDFERKMMQKQKLVARVSPARTPSHLIASMTLASTAKKRRPAVSGSDSDSSSLNSSPIRHETPLKKSKTLMKEAIALHSDYSGSEDEASLVYPEEPVEEEPVKKPSQSRCIIM